jgi:phenylalanyl-tRNA synthetase beta chain
VKENRGYGDDFGIFEIGHTVEGLREDGYCNEQNKLGAVFYSKTRTEESVFLGARDAVAEICESILHRDVQFVAAECEYDFQHPVNTFDVVVAGVKVGYLSVPHPTVCENIDRKCAVAFFELRTEAFASVAAATVKYAVPSKFPAIEIDVTFTADVGAIVFPELESAARAAAGELLSSMWLKDVYEQDGSSAVTLRFAFCSAERTLTKQELTPATEAIANAFAQFGMTVKM